MPKQRYQLIAEVDRDLYMTFRKQLLEDELQFKRWLEVAIRAYINKRPLTLPRWKKEARS